MTARWSLLPVIRYDAGETFDEGLDLPQRRLLLFPFERFPFRAVDLHDQLVNLFLRGLQQLVVRMRWIRMF